MPLGHDEPREGSSGDDEESHDEARSPSVRRTFYEGVGEQGEECDRQHLATSVEPTRSGCARLSDVAASHGEGNDAYWNVHPEDAFPTQRIDQQSAEDGASGDAEA